MQNQKNQDVFMQLTLTVLGKKSSRLIPEILNTISDCQCYIKELKSSQLAHSTVAFMLIEGNWNHIAKLETSLDNLQKRLDCQISRIRPESVNNANATECIPYSLETISLNHDSILDNITTFLTEHRIAIQEINASCYQASYIPTPILSSKFVLLIPPEIGLLCFREELLDFCDNLNIDAIIEPITR